MIVIYPGGQIDVDPSDWTVLYFSWDKHMPPGIELLDAGTFTMFCESNPEEDPVTLELDSQVLLAGNRIVQFRTKGGTPGESYNIAHHVVYVSSPLEKRERSFTLNVIQR